MPAPFTTHSHRRALRLVVAIMLALALGACGRPEAESTGPSSPARALSALFDALWSERPDIAERYLDPASRTALFGEGSGVLLVPVWLPFEGDIEQTDIEAGVDDDHVTVILRLQSGQVVRVPATRVDQTWQFDLTP